MLKKSAWLQTRRWLTIFTLGLAVQLTGQAQQTGGQVSGVKYENITQKLSIELHVDEKGQISVGSFEMGNEPDALKVL